MQARLKEFSAIMQQIGRKHGLSQAFNDFATMAVCSYHVVNIQSKCTKTDPENEARYLEVSKRYDREELNAMAKAMGTLHLNAHENPFTDLLSTYCIEKITKSNLPYPSRHAICRGFIKVRLLKMKSHRRNIPQKGWTCLQFCLGLLMGADRWICFVWLEFSAAVLIIDLSWRCICLHVHPTQQRGL